MSRIPMKLAEPDEKWDVKILVPMEIMCMCVWNCFAGIVQDGSEM